MKREIHAFLSICAVSVPLGAATAASQIVVRDGATDWTNIESYEQSVVPGAGDTARLKAGTTVYVADEASLNVVSNVTMVEFYGGDASKIVFDVPEGETWGVGCYIRSGNNGVAAGHLVKRGGGTLQLRTPRNENGSYNCNITVEEGSLRMSEAFTFTYNNAVVYSGYVAVSNNATLFAPGNADSDRPIKWLVRGFIGDGLITNVHPSCVTISPIVNKSDWVWDGVTCVFGGAFKGFFDYTATGMRQMFTGTNSTIRSFSPKADDGNLAAGEGTTGLAKLGNIGEFSSAGTNHYIRWIGGGGILYLGKGESCNKELQIQEGGRPFIDGGAFGGLVFTEDLNGFVDSTHAKFDKTLTLDGSNTTACALAGNVPSWRQSNLYYTFNIVKRGSGIWRLDYPASTMSGTIAVEEGTLGFSVLKERGAASSFGTSSSDEALDAAITLGTPETEGGIALMSVTNGPSQSTSRPIVLSGDARFTNDTTNYFGVGGIDLREAAARTVTFDGAGTNNAVYSLADGAGTLSVVKEGSGTWRLSGTNSFSGALDVRAGTLVLSNPTNYTYYKWVIKSLHGSSSYTVHVAEFGLYDDADNRLNGGMTLAPYSCNISPGEGTSVGYGRFDRRDDNPFEKLFDANQAPFKTFVTVPVEDDELTWTQILMRLPEGSASVASWDFACGTHAVNNSATNDYPKACSLYGSVDGINFDLLDEIAEADYGTVYRAWSATKEAVSAANSAVHPGGYKVDRTAPSPFPSPTNALVSVAAGATLRAEGFRPVITRLGVSASGAGSLENFSFAPRGELYVSDLASRKSIDFPGNYTDVEGISNLKNWKVYVNGKPSTWRVKEVNGTLQLIAPGFMILFR